MQAFDSYQYLFAKGMALLQSTDTDSIRRGLQYLNVAEQLRIRIK